MNRPTHPVAQRLTGRPPGSNSGAALVITLACIVILTALVLAVLTHSMLETQVSDASASQTEASLFARGAVDSVIGALKQEITAGSASTYPPTGSDVRDPNCFFLPTTNQTVVPYRMDSGAPSNVIKRSAYNVPFYTGTYYSSTWPAPNWAANLSTTNVGPTGRAISMARWNKPLLMPVASTTDLTPTNTFIPPDWVYVTRMEGPVTTWNANLVANTPNNTNSVVGRYAYVVYDEGGLLDANAAGYPSSVTASMVRHKISEACADLTQVGLASSDIDALVAWRNASIGTNNGSGYTNYVYSATTNAFLTPATGDRLFTSRQQLIAFLSQNVANGDPTALARIEAALPYLTTFSRELNAPSWYPQTNIGVAFFTSYPYLKNATNNVPSATTTNIFVPLARAGTSYTDGSSLTVQSNQSVAFSRFPLTRLAWLGPSGPANGATAAQIQQSFGLLWDSTNYAWKYVGPTGSTVLSSISTLAQISGRQPNFFELLKAGILSGSVNVTPAVQTLTYPSPGAVDPRYSQNDQQIMQIGLSMIDQTTSAVLPTRIEFGANTTGDWNGALYGSKNLPYLYRMIFSPYRPTTMPPDVTNGVSYTQQYFTAWEEPVFWSPYQMANTNSTSSLQIRIRADGTNSPGISPGNIGSDTSAGPSAATTYNMCVPEVPCGTDGSSTDVGGSNGASIALTGTLASALNTATSSPVLLSSLLTNGFTATFNDLRAASPSVSTIWPYIATSTTKTADYYSDTNTVTPYVGFWLGQVLAPNQPDPNYLKVSGTYYPYQQAEFYSGPTGHRSTQQFVVEANYGTSASPSWQEVQRMRFNTTTSHSNDVEEYDNFTLVGRRLDFQTFNDPRTGRFSFDLAQPADYNASAPSPGYSVTGTATSAVTWTTFNSSANYFSGLIKYAVMSNPSANPYTFLPTPNWTVGAAPINLDTFRWADNTAAAGANTTPIYQDTDGVKRPGDGWWNTATANTLPMRQDLKQAAPVLLNRSFYSVGELGYVFRDTPWRSLNFSSVSSPDAGLLDLFCVNDGYAGSTNAPVVAGVLDLNTTHPQVLAAMLSGAARAQLYPAYDVSSADATSMANTITSITGTLPLINKSQIATRLTPIDPTVQTTATAEPGIDTNIKERREVITRALASAGQVRTWNLMVDVIAQTGHLPPTATGFNNFIVTAEQRYWAHVAIDRFTGQVISVQLEPVSE
jgi:hypothetical protein